MSKIDHLAIDLEPEVAASVTEAIAAGDYASSDDIIREALINWRLTRLIMHGSSQELGRLWREGRESGEAVEATDLFNRLRARYSGKSSR